MELNFFIRIGKHYSLWFWLEYVIEVNRESYYIY